MTTPEGLTTVHPVQFWAGTVLSTLVILFLVFDGVTKIIKVKPVVEASVKLGVAESLLQPIGIVLLLCTAVYAVPKTAVLGAVLLTGYLGGAVATHVLTRSDAFPIAFSAGFGVLVWVGLVLREPRLLSVVLFRQ